MYVKGWCIWYVNDVKIDSNQMAWEEAPEDGVLGVAIYFGDYGLVGGPHRRLCAGSDYYFRTPNGLIGHNDHQPEETLVRYPGAVIKRGIWGLDVEMIKVQREMTEVRDL